MRHRLIPLSLFLYAAVVLLMGILWALSYRRPWMLRLTTQQGACTYFLRSDSGHVELTIQSNRTTAPVGTFQLTTSEYGKVGAAGSGMQMFTDMFSGPRPSAFSLGKFVVNPGSPSFNQYLFYPRLTMYRTPHWLVGGAVVLLLSVPSSTMYCRRRWRRGQGRCVVCGYDLRATPGRCPECGTECNRRDTESAETAAES